MSNNIVQIPGTPTTITCTLSSIATNNGRISDGVNVAGAAAQAGRIAIELEVESGTAPAAGTIYKVYCVRSDGISYTDDGLTLGDAALSVEPLNSQYLGSIVLSNDANKKFYGFFIIENPGPIFGIVFWNPSGQTTNATPGNHFLKQYSLLDQIVG